MQLLISAILTLALGAGAFFSLNQHPNSIVGSANGQGNKTVKTEITENTAINPTPTATISPTPTVSPSHVVTANDTNTNNGLHLGILRGKPLGGGKEELNENDEGEIHQHPTPSPTPVNLQTSIGIQTSVIPNEENGDK
jgi:hypothetical protein